MLRKLKNLLLSLISQVKRWKPQLKRECRMAPQVLADLAAAVERTKGVDASAVVFINGFAARLQAAVDAAIANGATAEELKPVTDEVAGMTAASDALAAALATNP
jgi:hypothetical protein